ncbi:MAG: hypothetical protein JXR88_01420 [Clostridia bacterium]|nr:hypothetical protein [Clostridia bacterium]
MIRLFNYEIQRKWKTSLGILGLYFLIYFGFLLKWNKEIRSVMDNMNMSNFDMDLLIQTFGFKIIFFIILASGLFFASIIGAVNNLRLEAKQSSRDLYFSIPMTAYTKIGSKVIVSLVEVFAASFIGFVSVIKAFEFLTKFDIMKGIIDSIFAMPTDALIYMIIGNVLQSTLMILMVYLSFAIFRSFFSQAKLGWLITIGIYIGLNYLMIRFLSSILMTVGDAVKTSLSMWGLLAGFALFVGAIFFIVGFLFEKRVSFD